MDTDIAYRINKKMGTYIVEKISGFFALASFVMIMGFIVCAIIASFPYLFRFVLCVFAVIAFFFGIGMEIFIYIVHVVGKTFYGI